MNISGILTCCLWYRNRCVNGYVTLADVQFDDDDEFTFDFKTVDIYSMKLVMSATERAFRRMYCSFFMCTSHIAIEALCVSLVMNHCII